MHIGQSSTPISKLNSENDKIYLGLISVGNFCTFIATLGSYFVRIKNHQENGEETFQQPWDKILLSFAVFSVLNKSLATSSSAYALTYDYTEEPYYLWTVFFVGLVANIFVQTSVQMEITDWHGPFSKKLMFPISVVFTTIYNITLLALNWNTLNSFLISCKFINLEDRVSFYNMFATRLSRSMVITAAPLFLCAAVRNEVKFIPDVVNRFTPKPVEDDETETIYQIEYKNKDEIKTSPSLLSNILTGINRITAIGNSLQRTALMFLSFAAFVFLMCEDDTTGYILAFSLAVICLRGNWKANFSLLFPAEKPTELPLEKKPKESIKLEEIITDTTRLLQKPRDSKCRQLLCCPRGDNSDDSDNYARLN